MPLVSVIIPTHNRACYAIPTIQSIFAASPDIEVIVCDTSEVDLISPALSTHPDFSRLCLIRPNRPMSVVDNFNKAMSVATGDYLVFIGDDDFVSHAIVDVATWAAQQQIDAVKFSFPVTYYWPDFKHSTRGDEYSGTLHISPYTGEIHPYDAKQALLDAIYNFGGGVLEMPRAYAGMISLELAKRISMKYGMLFGGVSPDIYSAALISLEVERCIKLDFPVVIPGSSGASTAGQSANGQHRGALRDNAHIGAFKNLNWDDRIPEFYSVPTVWSYSLLKALECASFNMDKVNFPRLYAKCLIYQRSYLSATFTSLRTYANSKNWWSTGLKLVKAGIEEAAWVFGKLTNRFLERNDMADKQIRHALNDTQSAAEALKAYIVDIGMPLNMGKDDNKNLPI